MNATLAPPSAMTTEEFAEWANLPENSETLFELDDGRIITMSSPGERHGLVASWIAHVFWMFVIQTRKGRVIGNDTGVILARKLGIVRGPDVMFLPDALPLKDVRIGHVEEIPSAVIEVISPSDRFSAILRRVNQYLKRGVGVVWVVDPEDCIVHEYRKNELPKMLTDTDLIDGGSAIPRLPVQSVRLLLLADQHHRHPVSSPMPPLRLSAVLLLLAFALGCGKKDSAAPTTKDSKKDSIGTPTQPTSGGDPAIDTKAPLAAAQAFLKAPSGAALAPAFKARIAPAELDADNAAGYSESGVRDWLASLGTAVQLGELRILSARGPAVLFAGRFAGNQPPESSATTFLQVSFVNSLWLVNEFCTYFVNGKNAELRHEDAERAAVAFAFANAILAKKPSQVEALLSPSLKAKLAPPLFDSDKAAGYNSGNLQSALLEYKPLFNKNPAFEWAGATALFAAADNKIELAFTAGPSQGLYLINDIRKK